MNECSGLKAHRTLAPASIRYVRRKMMWGGKRSRTRRERFRTAKPTEIAAMAGQKILFSERLCMMLCSVSPGPPLMKSSSGDTIMAKAHAEIGTIAHVSRKGVEDLARLNSKECIDAFDILALDSALDVPQTLTLG